MKRLLLTLTLLFFNSAAFAFWFDVNSCTSFVQTNGPVIVSLGGGLYRWETTIEVTNNSKHTLNELSMVSNYACQGANAGKLCTSSVTKMPWNNNVQQWDPNPTGNVFAIPDNISEFVLISPSNTNIAPNSDHNIFEDDSLPAFLVGDIQSGETRAIRVDYILNTNQSLFYFGLEVVATNRSCIGSTRLRINDGYIKIDVTNGNIPPSNDCSDADHIGRMIFDGINNTLYMCGQSGWQAR